MQLREVQVVPSKKNSVTYNVESKATWPTARIFKENSQTAKKKGLSYNFPYEVYAESVSFHVNT